MQDPLPTVVVDYLAGLLGNEVLKGLRATGVKSAQQRVWIVEFSSSDDWSPTENLPLDWRNALQEGNNRIVIRLWRGGARWWNLNNDDKSRVGALARAETKAYQIARKALPDLHIPRLLHAKLTSNPFPWAVFSYVGYDSTYYHHRFAPNRYWIDGMVKIRHEFGFDEPHPRWGRVPQDECLQYTLEVLRNVTMPLHRYLAENNNNNNNTPQVDLCCEDNDNNPITYQTMVVSYRRALERKIEGMDDFQKRLYVILQQCISRLEAMTIEPLPPVLVHMDCQPQNLLFATVVAPDNDKEGTVRIMSVLDWEEAAYADPRFELLLLVRKVCANRYQADIVWNTYAQEQQQPDLGSMEPWLQLETVHSITALFLQSLDLGGRSPWETKPDLWGKIQRELHRLAELGWEFCQIDDA